MKKFAINKIKLIFCILICMLLVATNFSGAKTGFSDEIDDQNQKIAPIIISNSKIGDRSSTIDINSSDDAQVVEGYPSSNYGSATYMYVQSASSGASNYQDERAWIKFDINGVIPEGATINSALLHLYCWKATGPTMDASVHGSTDDSWKEMSLTWDNQASFETELDSIQLVAGQTYVWKEWNVTSFVQSEWADDKVISFVVKPTVENTSTAKTFSFDSKEYSSGNYAPILQVDYETQPGQPVVSDIPDQFIELGNSFSPILLDDYVDDSDHQDDEITWTYSGNIELTVDIDPATRIATITVPSIKWTGQETITFRATDPELLWDEDSATFTVTPWIETSTSPYIHSYAVGVVCAGEYVILANGETTSSSKIMKYNISSDYWTTFSNPPYHFKNSVAMIWDKTNYVYTLFGGSYSDCRNQARHYFSRFNINTNNWENLPDSPWYQGPGDAITWINTGDYEYIYALLGSSSCSGAPWGYPGPAYPEGVQFWRYNVSGNVWDQNLTRIPYGSDDGADLIWTGGDYIYAFCGAYNEGLPKDEERHFLRYSISGDSWVELENTPYRANGGIDDGGSLLYPGYGDYIYALKGGDDGAGGGGSPGDDFWRYSISDDIWEILPSIPEGIGDQNGHRLGLSGRNIYCWRGCFSDGTLWSYSIDIPPCDPVKPSGRTVGTNNRLYTYNTLSTDAEGDQIYYNFSWDDGSYSGWMGPYDSGALVEASHSWSHDGLYYIMVKAKDVYDVESDWSESLVVRIFGVQVQKMEGPEVHPPIPPG